jgi:hypothetical protein
MEVLGSDAPPSTNGEQPLQDVTNHTEEKSAASRLSHLLQSHLGIRPLLLHRRPYQLADRRPFIRPEPHPDMVLAVYRRGGESAQYVETIGRNHRRDLR